MITIVCQGYSNDNDCLDNVAVSLNALHIPTATVWSLGEITDLEM
jgi:hypothetical protein